MLWTVTTRGARPHDPQPRQGSAMPDQSRNFDLAIIGSGIACTLTLQAFLAKLERRARPVDIVVVERDPQFWRGFPYGDRSSPNSLIITTLGEFVPDCERDDFVAWLIAERERWTHELSRTGGQVAQRWLAENGAAMDAGDWDEIYVPRILYGQFAEARLARLVTDAEAAGLARVTLVHGEAVDVEPRGGRYRVVMAGQERTLDARVILLAIGSPPFAPLQGAGESGAHYVNNAYLPGLSQNLQAIRSRLEAAAPGRKNLLIVGSNATSLEALYMISRDDAFRRALDKVVVLSTGGLLPHKMTRDRFRVASFPRMEALKTAASLTPRDIVVAAEADVAALDPQRDPPGDTFHHLSSQLVDLLGRLDAAQQKQFHHGYGMRFTRLIRRAGAEYRDAADALQDGGKLDILRGRFLELRRAPSPDAAALDYAPEGGDERATSPLDFPAVVNCTGFEDLSERSLSPLIASLIRRDLARVNETGRGFLVDESFQTAQRVLLCGPLLNGVFNGKAQFWHVENVRRIQFLADIIANSALDLLAGSHDASESVAMRA